VRGDARRYLDRTRRRFDLVVEDVFVGSARSVRKPDWLPDPGLARAAHCLHPGGVLVSNSIDETADVARAMRGLFPSTLRIDVEGYDKRSPDAERVSERQRSSARNCITVRLKDSTDSTITRWAP
jgi:hypothetical protein